MAEEEKSVNEVQHGVGTMFQRASNKRRREGGRIQISGRSARRPRAHPHPKNRIERGSKSHGSNEVPSIGITKSRIRSDRTQHRIQGGESN